MLIVVVIILILMGTGVIKGNREPLGAGMRIAFGVVAVIMGLIIFGMTAQALADDPAPEPRKVCNLSKSTGELVCH